MRILFVVTAIAILSGCASPPDTADALPVPKDRLIALQANDGTANAQVTVMREWGFAGGGCYVGVYIDGRLVARMDNNERATFYIKPGRRLVGVGVDPKGNGSCRNDGNYKREVATWIQSEEKQNFRISLNPGFDIRASSY